MLAPLEEELIKLQGDVTEGEAALQGAMAAMADAAWNAGEQWKDATMSDLEKLCAWKARFESGGDLLHAPHPHWTSLYKRQRQPESPDPTEPAAPITPWTWAAGVSSQIVISVAKKETIRNRQVGGKANEGTQIHVVTAGGSPALQIVESSFMVPETSPPGFVKSLANRFDGVASPAVSEPVHESTSGPQMPVESRVSPPGEASTRMETDTTRVAKRGAADAELTATPERTATSVSSASMPVDDMAQEDALFRQGQRC